MKVHELIAELEQYDRNMGVGTIVNDHCHVPSDERSHGAQEVGVLRHYAGDYVVIGNVGLFSSNYPNWYMLGEEEIQNEGLR